MKLKIMSYDEFESKMHEEAEARYTKLREGEFSGEIPQAYGNLGGALYDGDMKKTRDPVEEKENG
jgi:hypothetical protein